MSTLVLQTRYRSKNFRYSRGNGQCSLVKKNIRLFASCEAAAELPANPSKDVAETASRPSLSANGNRKQFRNSDKGAPLHQQTDMMPKDCALLCLCLSLILHFLILRLARSPIDVKEEREREKEAGKEDLASSTLTNDRNERSTRIKGSLVKKKNRRTGSTQYRDFCLSLVSRIPLPGKLIVRG